MPDALSAVVIAAVVIGPLVLMARRLFRHAEDRKVYAQTVAALRWWMAPVAVVHLAVVVAVFSWLMGALPFLRFGWWSAFGGTGNIALGQTMHAGSLWQLLGLVLPGVAALLVPLLAYREEQLFRVGSEGGTRWSCIRKQVAFGLVHPLFAGVPLAAGVALILSGFLYLVVYRVAMTRAVDALVSSPAERLPLGCVSAGSPSDANRRVVGQWMTREQERIRTETRGRAAARATATATSAALHAMTNWLVLGSLLVSLLLSLR